MDTLSLADETPARLSSSFVSAAETLRQVILGAAGTPWKAIVAAFVA